MASASFLKGQSFQTPSGGDDAGVTSLRSVPAEGDAPPFATGVACLANFNGTEGPTGTMTGTVKMSYLVLRGTGTMASGELDVDLTPLLTAAGGITGLPSAAWRPTFCWAAGGTQLGTLYLTNSSPLGFGIASTNPTASGSINWLALYDPTNV